MRYPTVYFLPKAYILIMTNVTGPPTAAAAIVPQNCGKCSVFIVMNVTKTYIIKLGTYDKQNLTYRLKDGFSLKIKCPLRKNAIVSEIA